MLLFIFLWLALPQRWFLFGLATSPASPGPGGNQPTSQPTNQPARDPDLRQTRPRQNNTSSLSGQQSKSRQPQIKSSQQANHINTKDMKGHASARLKKPTAPQVPRLGNQHKRGLGKSGDGAGSCAWPPKLLSQGLPAPKTCPPCLSQSLYAHPQTASSKRSTVSNAWHGQAYVAQVALEAPKSLAINSAPNPRQTSSLDQA